VKVRVTDHGPRSITSTRSGASACPSYRELSLANSLGQEIDWPI
jgi:hypothetical protein